MKWWMTAVTALSVVGVMLLPGIGRHQPVVSGGSSYDEAITVRPESVTTLESIKATGANEHLVVVSRPEVSKAAATNEIETHEAPATATTSAGSATGKAPSEPAVSSTTADARLVTITGCLESDHDRLLLKDTTGAAAPKGRSWKSGFLKKQSASLQLVEPTHVLKLGTYDGQRVSVSGTLDDRELHVHSVQRVDKNCN